MRLQPFIVTSLVLGSLLAVDADAQAPEPLVFPAVADTYVHAAGHWKRRTFGTDTTLRADAKPERISYLRFAVSGVGTDRISRAVLRLQVSTASGSDSRSGGTIRRISNTTWRETSVTYATRPALDGPALATAGRVARGAAVDFDVTAAVGGDGLYSFALTTGSDDEVVYTSRETRTPPLLLLTLRGDPPTVLITAPSDGATFVAGAPITLHATATDVDDGDLGAALIWASDRQGVLGIGATLTTVLDAGPHTITAGVADSSALAGGAQVVVVANAAPAVAIVAPATDAALVANRPVVLAARAIDAEDGDVGASVEWESDRDGALGTGRLRTVAGLSAGAHVLTARARDGDGASGATTLRVTIRSNVQAVVAGADTYVDGASPARNAGKEDMLRVDAEPRREALLRFTVAGLAPFTVASAALELTVGPLDNDSSNAGGTLHAHTGGGWSESTTFLTRPAITGPPLDTVGPVDKGDRVRFDVSGAVTREGVYDFALVTASSDSVVYRSRESSTRRPTLEVILAHDAPPAVLITEPLPGGTVIGGAVRLAARAADAEDGDLSARIIWRSDVQGLLGSGPEVTVTLAPGRHVVTASVTDAAGHTATESVPIAR